MKHLILSTITVLALSIYAQDVGAQTITGYQLRIYLNGGGAAPVTTYDFSAAAVACGVTPKAVAPAGVAANPNTLSWDNPTNPTIEDCRWTDPGTGPLLALPFSMTSTYTARVVYVNTAGMGPEGTPSNPFSRPGSSPVTFPANVRMHRP